jgi:regulator of replication initiation timing
MTTSDNRHSNNNNNQTKDVEIDSGIIIKNFLFTILLTSCFLELLELETALNNIEKAMDKIESQNSSIQTRLRDLLESNKQMSTEFSDIRRGMANKFKEVHRQLEEMPGIAHDLAAVTSSTLIKIEQDMSPTNDIHKFE